MSAKAQSKVSQAASLKAITGFVSDDDGGDFQRLLNDRVRLGILSSLAVSNVGPIPGFGRAAAAGTVVSFVAGIFLTPVTINGRPSTEIIRASMRTGRA